MRAVKQHHTGAGRRYPASRPFFHSMTKTVINSTIPVSINPSPTGGEHNTVHLKPKIGPEMNMSTAGMASITRPVILSIRAGLMCGFVG